MANPEHIAELDGVDRLTVSLYRAGLGLSAVLIFALAAVYGLRWGQAAPPAWIGPGLMVALGCASTLCAVNLHLYVKTVRWVLQAAAPFGLALQALALALPPTWWISWPLQTAGLGFGLVTLSGLALKERFCFRIFGLRIVPALLAGATLAVLVDWPPGVILTLFPSSIVLGWLTVAKTRQPLHYDIGDKSAYQI